MKQLLLSVILVVFLYCTNSSFAQAIIQVWGGNEDQARRIEQQANLYLSYLKVEDELHLTVALIKKMPENLNGITLLLDSPDPENLQVFRILIDATLDFKKQLFILAHEMIHVKQYAKQELIPDQEKGVTWKGKRYDDPRGYNEYMPWEKEAYHLDQTLVNEVKIFEEKFSQTLAENNDQCSAKMQSYSCIPNN